MKGLMANLAIYENFSLFLSSAACLLCPLARSPRRTVGEEQQQRFAVEEYLGFCVAQGFRTEAAIPTAQRA